MYVGTIVRIKVYNFLKYVLPMGSENYIEYLILILKLYRFQCTKLHTCTRLGIRNDTVRSQKSKNIAIVSNGAAANRMENLNKNQDYKKYHNSLIFGSAILNTLSTETYFIQNIHIAAQFATPSTLLPTKAVQSS